MAGLATCAAPSSESLPLQLASGFYPLLSYNGKPIPHDIGEIPTRDGRPSGCFLVYAAAGMTLDVAGQRWHYFSEYRESCQGRLMGRLETPGTFRQLQDQLEFTIPAIDTTCRYTGRVFQDRFEFYWGNEVLVFPRIPQ